MPPVANVFDHWLSVESLNVEQPESQDILFWFGYEQPADILVNVGLSAHTVGIHYAPDFVGSVGGRIRRYVYVNRRGNIDYKENPLSYDWNSERIDGCVSVEVRLTVHYAQAFALSTVYVFKRREPLLLERAKSLQTRHVVAYDGSSGQTKHSTKVVGLKAELEGSWGEIENAVRASAADASGLEARALRLLETPVRGLAPRGRVDLATGRLVRERRRSFRVAVAGGRPPSAGRA